MFREKPKYVQKVCHWKYHGMCVGVPNDIESIYSYQHYSWFSTNGCNSKDDITLCDIRSFKEINDPCLMTTENANLTRCKLSISKDPYINEAIQT